MHEHAVDEDPVPAFRANNAKQLEPYTQLELNELDSVSYVSQER